MLRVVVLAGLAVCGQAGYLADLPNEGASKNRIVKVVQFPKISMVSGAGRRLPRGSSADGALC
jgi:hypothetical protein